MPRHRDACDREHYHDGHLAYIARNQSKQSGAVVFEFAVRRSRPSSPSTEQAAFFWMVFDTGHHHSSLTLERVLDLDFAEAVAVLVDASAEAAGLLAVFGAFAAAFTSAFLRSSR